MVNPNKHKQIKFKIGMLPFEDTEFMQKFVEKIISDVNDDPQITIDGLNALHDELTKYYNSISGTSGGVLKIGTCQRILEIYENVYVIKNIIQNNYPMLKIESKDIKALLNASDSVLNEFDDIQKRQNKNIDNKTHGGFYSVQELESNNQYSDYPKENFEKIIRLEKSIQINGVQGFL